MQVTSIKSMMSFGRSLTAKEKEEFSALQNQAKKALNLGKTTATIFDFSIPTKEHDTGIGTSFSYDAQKMAEFLKAMCGINSIQLQPQGEISNFIRSPYSGTSFSLGMHIIDLTKLKSEKYGNLLSENDINSSYMNRTRKSDSVNYDNVFSEDGQKAMLKKAYLKFAKLSSSSPLKNEFEKFKKENTYWLEKDALFDACAQLNNSGNVRDWPYEYQNVFATKEGNKKLIENLKKVTDENGINIVDFSEFVQFIADKQQKESKVNFNNQGIEIYGDCQIGFSDKDVWAHKSAFYDNIDFGCDIGNNQYSCWSPAIDFRKLTSDAGELLYNKFNLFFKRYNGVRIDAAWQLIKPILCEPVKEYGHDKFDSNGNKLGRKISSPYIPDDGRYIIKNIILKAADDNNVSHDRVFLELLGGNAYDSLDAVKNTGAQLIHITRYSKQDWGRVKHYEARSDNKYQNMRPGDYTIGIGTHDDPTLIEQVTTRKDSVNKAGTLARDLNLNSFELNSSDKKLADAAFAELFTTKNQFATLPDILGSDRRINEPNTKNANWAYRATKDYEKEYFDNLSNGRGLNFADALVKALKAKGINNPALINGLKKFDAILRQPE